MPFPVLALSGGSGRKVSISLLRSPVSNQGFIRQVIKASVTPLGGGRPGDGSLFTKISIPFLHERTRQLKELDSHVRSCNLAALWKYQPKGRAADLWFPNIFARRHSCLLTARQGHFLPDPLRLLRPRPTETS